MPKGPTPFPEATPNNLLVPPGRISGAPEGPCGVVRYLALEQCAVFSNTVAGPYWTSADFDLSGPEISMVYQSRRIH